MPEAEFSVMTGMKFGWTRWGLLLLVELRDFPFAHDHTAHAGSDDDADAMGVFFGHLEAGVGQCFFGGDKGKLRVAVHAFGLDTVEVPFGREVANLACDLGTVAVHGKRVEASDRRDA